MAVLSLPDETKVERLFGGPTLNRMGLIFFSLAVGMFATIAVRRESSARRRPQEPELPASVSLYIPKRAAIRALVRLGKTDPERWFIAYDQGPQARVALVEGSMFTDDKAFKLDRNFGYKLSLQNLQSISVPGAETSFILSFGQDGDRAAKYFCVVTFASGALDIKLFVATVSGRAQVLDNPFRVRIWSKLPSASPGAERNDVTEYGLPNINATKLVKIRQETKSME